MFIFDKRHLFLIKCIIEKYLEMNIVIKFDSTIKKGRKYNYIINDKDNITENIKTDAQKI